MELDEELGEDGEAILVLVVDGPAVGGGPSLMAALCQKQLFRVSAHEQFMRFNLLCRSYCYSNLRSCFYYRTNYSSGSHCRCSLKWFDQARDKCKNLASSVIDTILSIWAACKAVLIASSTVRAAVLSIEFAKRVGAAFDTIAT